MSNSPVLELADIPNLHPLIGKTLLDYVAAPTIFRLCIDPVAHRSDTIKRTVSVEWIKRPGDGPPIKIQREIGWKGMAAAVGQCAQLPFAISEQDITEWAAIGVMALLIHNLEQTILKTVLQIGSGGDYLVRWKGSRQLTQIEVSGIREDATGGLTSTRLGVKLKQVLTEVKHGFVSVTTFAHRADRNVCSHLRFVRRKRKHRDRQE